MAAAEGGNSEAAARVNGEGLYGECLDNHGGHDDSLLDYYGRGVDLDYGRKEGLRMECVDGAEGVHSHVHGVGADAAADGNAVPDDYF